MKDAFPRGRTAVVGAATFGMGEAPGYESMDLAVKAGLLALKDANIALSEVDGLFISLPDEFISGIALAEYLGLRPRITDNNRTGGSAPLTQMLVAALALEAGQCDVALICYGSNQRSKAGKLIASAKPSPYESPYKPVPPVTSYALSAARYMHEYGATKEHLGHVALSARAWAQRNPAAFARDPMTMDDYLASRIISEPFGARDCCLVTDGAAAVVMVRADRAKAQSNRPVYLLGLGAATTHMDMSSMPDLTVTGAVQSGATAFAQAGYRPGDIEVVQLYDAFTINTLLFLEDLGFCKKGEGAQFVMEGRIAPGGELPVNTNGGGLSCVHPGMYGLFAVAEACEQIIGRTGERQVPGVQLALAHGNGGKLSSQVTAILGSEETL